MWFAVDARIGSEQAKKVGAEDCCCFPYQMPMGFLMKGSGSVNYFRSGCVHAFSGLWFGTCL